MPRFGICRLGLALCAIIAIVPAIGPGAWGFEWNQDNSCVLLNECNADPFTRPTDCDLPENLGWCNCVRTIFTNPIRGQNTAVEQGVIWIQDTEPGIGNMRLEVRQGTLDVSGMDAGDVIGTMQVKELIPEGAGAPPGALFIVRGQAQVTGKTDNVVDFDIILNEYNSYVIPILGYDPKAAQQSDGLLYRGRLTANGDNLGFTLEYRYQTKPGRQYAALRPGDVASPGFNVRFALSYFGSTTAAATAYTLPAVDPIWVDVTTTIRKFRETGGQIANPAEILPLGEADLCQVIPDGEPSPCRTFEDSLPITNPGSNKAPMADVCATDPLTMGPLATVYIECGEGRAIMRGSNSSDGNNGSQGLTYLWEIVDGTEGGAVIPEGMAAFQDVEISFYEPGQYTIRLTVNDGQTENNTDSQEVVVTAEMGGIEDNVPPEITKFVTTPDPPEVELQGGTANVHFDADANTGNEGCQQTLVITWECVGCPAPVTFTDPDNDDTDVIFTASGDYVIRLTVDDGAPENNIIWQEKTVKVTSKGNTFMRCDSNGDGTNDLSDAVSTLGVLFLGNAEGKCYEAMDCNSDGTADLSDAISNLGVLFLGNTPPAPPYPNCDFAVVEACKESTTCEP